MNPSCGWAVLDGIIRFIKMSGRYVNPAVEARVLTRSARRCCLCYYLKRDFSEKEGQLAHLDHDRTNGAEQNLAFLCLPHHSLYDSKTSQHKNYTLLEVKTSRQELYARVESFSSDEDALKDEDDEPIEECEETAFLGSDEHKVYSFEMLKGQRIVGCVSSDDIIDLLICKERDYEEWSESEDAADDDDDIPLPTHFFYAEDILRRSFSFEAPRNGSFVVLSINWADEDTDITIDWALWESDEEE